MRSSFSPRSLSVCLCLLLLMSTGGAYATWIYAEMPVSGHGFGMDMNMSTFDYPPENIVPGGSVSAPVGENHLTLIEKILNEASYGLNATKKPIIHNTLKNPGDPVAFLTNRSEAVRTGNS